VSVILLFSVLLAHYWKIGFILGLMLYITPSCYEDLGPLSDQMVEATFFESLALQCCGFEFYPGLWILSYKGAIN
jgi:hypothetical protein